MQDANQHEVLRPVSIARLYNIHVWECMLNINLDKQHGQQRQQTLQSLRNKFLYSHQWNLTFSFRTKLHHCYSNYCIAGDTTICIECLGALRSLWTIWGAADPEEGALTGSVCFPVSSMSFMECHSSTLGGSLSCICFAASKTKSRHLNLCPFPVWRLICMQPTRC